MFVTKKHLPRRTFLKGVGVSLALPLLDSMIPARTLLAQTAARPLPSKCGPVPGAIMAKGNSDTLVLVADDEPSTLAAALSAL